MPGITTTFTFMGVSFRNVSERFGGESSDEEIERLSDLAKKAMAQVIGRGGSKKSANCQSRANQNIRSVDRTRRSTQGAYI